MFTGDEKKVWIEEVIITRNLKRGKGVVGNPYRYVTQVWSKVTGQLLADDDVFKNDLLDAQEKRNAIDPLIPGGLQGAGQIHPRRIDQIKFTPPSPEIPL